MRGPILLLAMVACGGDGPVSQKTIDRYCDTFCDKADECGMFEGFMTAEECREQCVGQQEATPGDDCQITEAEARACLDDFEATTCEQLESDDLPASCEICEPVTPVPPTPPPAATCADLAVCCAVIPDPDTAEGCDSLVQSGNDPLCAQTLSGFQLAGFCP